MVDFIFFHRGIDPDGNCRGKVFEDNIFKVQIAPSQTDPHPLIGDKDALRVICHKVNRQLFFLCVVKISSGDLFHDLRGIHLLQQNLRGGLPDVFIDRLFDFLPETDPAFTFARQEFSALHHNFCPGHTHNADRRTGFSPLFFEVGTHAVIKRDAALIINALYHKKSVSGFQIPDASFKGAPCFLKRFPVVGITSGRGNIIAGSGFDHGACSVEFEINISGAHSGNQQKSSRQEPEIIFFHHRYNLIH